MQDDLDTDDLVRRVGAHLDAVLKKQNMGFALVVFPIQSGELPQDSVKKPASNLQPRRVVRCLRGAGRTSARAGRAHRGR